MREISLQGTFFEMGRQYGELCRKEIRKFVFSTRLMAAVGEGEARDVFRPKWYHVPGALVQIRKYRKKYRIIAGEFETNITKYYPEILEMMKGMGEGSDIDYRDILFMNCMAEYSMKCSTVGAAGSSTADGTPLLAMNADESKFVQRYEIVINMRPDIGYEFKAVYMAGCVFPNFGMNSQGLSTISELLFLDNEALAKLRMPMLLKFSFLHRCKDVEEARDVLDRLPPSGIGTATYVADSEKFIAIEENYKFKKINEYRNGYHFNCNLPQDEDLKLMDNRAVKNDIGFFFAVDREKRLGNLLKEHDGRINESALQDFLSDHGAEHDGTINRSICVHPENTKGIKTCVSFIASPADKTFILFEGNPCEHRMTTHRFNEELPVHGRTGYYSR